MALDQPASSFAEDVQAVTGFQDAPSVSTSRKKIAEIYEKVLQVATKYKVDKRAHEQLHDNHRGRDAALPFKRHAGVSGIRANDYQSAVAVAPSIKLRDDLPPLPAKVFSSWEGASKPEDSFIYADTGMGTQMPYICLKIFLRMPEGQPDKPVNVYIFGNNLSRKDAPHLGLHGKPIDLRTGYSKAVLESAGLYEKERHDVYQAALANLVTQVNVRLLGTADSGRYDLEGRESSVIKICGMVTMEELDDMAEKAVNTPEDLTEDRLFLGLLHARRIDNLSLLFRYSGKETSKEDRGWWKLCIYFELAMTLSAELGNLWFFRLQSEVDWQDRSFTFEEMELPHWMVTEWRDSDEQRTEGDAQDPAAWASIDVPQVYPGVEEHTFVQRAGLAIERKHQLVCISKLRKAYRHKAEATFHQNPDHPSYFLVKIRTQRPKAPPPNTTIQISLSGIIHSSVRL